MELWKMMKKLSLIQDWNQVSMNQKQNRRGKIGSYIGCANSYHTGWPQQLHQHQLRFQLQIQSPFNAHLLEVLQGKTCNWCALNGDCICHRLSPPYTCVDLKSFCHLLKKIAQKVTLAHSHLPCSLLCEPMSTFEQFSFLEGILYTFKFFREGKFLLYWLTTTTTSTSTTFSATNTITIQCTPAGGVTGLSACTG